MQPVLPRQQPIPVPIPPTRPLLSPGGQDDTAWGWAALARSLANTAARSSGGEEDKTLNDSLSAALRAEQAALRKAEEAALYAAARAQEAEPFVGRRGDVPVGQAPPACGVAPSSFEGGFDEAGECADLLVSECVDQAPAASTTSSATTTTATALTSTSAATTMPPSNDDKCRPRTALLLLYQGYLNELTDFADSQTELPAGLETQITNTESAIDALATPVPAIDLLTIGADQIVTEALEPVTNDDIPTGLARLGWALLAILGIVVYRRLEVTNGRRQPGPVEIKAGDSSDDDEKALVEQFKAHLGDLELVEPAEVPGGEAVKSASDVVKDSVQGAALKFVVAFLQATAFPKRGVEIEVAGRTISKHAPGSAEAQAETASGTAEGDSSGEPAQCYEVSIRGFNARTRELIFARNFDEEDRELAVQRAVYFAAEQVLATGYTTPGWQRWTPTDGRGLRAYSMAIRAKSSSPDAPETAKVYVERAVANNPATGVALVELSNQRALDQRFVAAAVWAARAVAREPRYTGAKYRLGVTLGMIASDMGEYWSHQPLRHELAALLGMSVDTADESSGGVATRETLLEKAATFLEEAIAQSGLWALLRSAAVQRERSYWLGILRTGRRDSALAAESALLLTRLRQGGEFEEDALDDTLRAAGHDHGTALYNAACYRTAAAAEKAHRKAVAEGLAQLGRELNTAEIAATGLASKSARWEVSFKDAQDTLVQARLARGGRTVTLKWAEADPDLAPLRAWPGWAAVATALGEFDGWAMDDEGQRDST